MKKYNLIGLVCLLMLTCLFVSCKKKDPVIKSIKNKQPLIESKKVVEEAQEPEEAKEAKEPEVAKVAKEPQEIVEMQGDDWKSIYLEFLDYSILETEYGDFLLFDDKINGIEDIYLYDLDHDKIPELFVEGGYESICIYSIKNNKLVFLDEIIPGTMDIRRDLATGKETMYISSLLEGDGGMFYLSTVDKVSGNISYKILFGHYMNFDEAEGQYYLNVKESTETLEDAFMDFESREVSKEIYDKAMEEYENSDQVIEQVIMYETPMYNEESFAQGLEMFKDALDDYAMNNE